MGKYGIPYMGSKSRIAEWIVSHLPAGGVLVDLFAGGCAVTHCAMLSGKWGRIICNDITDSPKLFFDAVDGKYDSEERWISREDFFLLKDTDPYVRILWSFGHDQKSYMYSRELEPYKRALHAMFHSKTVSDRRKAYVEVVERLREIGISEKNMRGVTSLQSQERLERLQSLRSLKSIESQERLERLQKDYRDVEIPEGAVVYCDIPYRDAKGYVNGFDHEAFYGWVRRQKSQVYVSEYWMPDDFTVVDETPLKSILSATNKSVDAIERLYGWNVEVKQKEQLTLNFG